MTDQEINELKKRSSKRILTKALSKMNNPVVFRHFEEMAEHFRRKDAWGLDYVLQQEMSGLNHLEYQLSLRHFGYRLKISKVSGFIVIVGK